MCLGAKELSMPWLHCSRSTSPHAAGRAPAFSLRGHVWWEDCGVHILRIDKSMQVMNGVRKLNSWSDTQLMERAALYPHVIEGEGPPAYRDDGT